MKVDGNKFRQARFVRFLKLADRQPSGRPVRIIDVGGTRSYWEAFRSQWEDRQFKITIVNLDPEPYEDEVYTIRRGNACALPEYGDNSFDIVHSNSVIEHVGQWKNMQAMAGEIRRLAPSYFVQTPNIWFPVEPHYRTAFIHWLPEPVRASMLLRKKRGFLSAGSLDEAMHNVQDINLLSAGQMAFLFPDAAIERERIALLTKSIIAIK